MYKTDPLLVEKCKILRREGFSLGEIVKIVHLPKTTVYDNIYDVVLSLEGQERLKKVQKRITEENTRRINEFNIKYRKGKCIPGRIIIKPKGWTNELIFLIAHFMFDGEVQTHSCIYHNRNEALINKVKSSMRKVFKLHPRNRLNAETGVYRIAYHYVELADYMREKARELKKYVRVASLPEKKIFLRAFFDDEGNVRWRLNQRSIRGFQHNLEILKLIQNLLKDFKIESKIDEKYKEIVISRKPNLIKFRDKINFSKRVYINPKRKNSIWKQKLEKREILDKIINSYQQ